MTGGILQKILKENFPNRNFRDIFTINFCFKHITVDFFNSKTEECQRNKVKKRIFFNSNKMDNFAATFYVELKLYIFFWMERAHSHFGDSTFESSCLLFKEKRSDAILPWSWPQLGCLPHPETKYNSKCRHSRIF